MNEPFLKIINMSISASWLVLAVLILRLVLKKAPKWINVLLWGIVAIRLICPFSFESALCFIPSAETIPLNIGMDTIPTINSGINAINNAVNPIISQSNTPMAGASANPLQNTIGIYEFIWIFGMTALVLYTVISYWRLHHKVDTAVLYKKNIFQSENVRSPFVLGIIKPRIYLPFNMDGQNLEHVIAHEQAHIRRKDHWWKPLGFLLLTIHWFNPLMWLAYVLLCRDIEFACDEKVIKELGNEQRADYTQALVTCSVNRRMIAACPLAFGEVGVKERVKSVMNYKKPAFWIVIVAVVTCIMVAVCFLTNPVSCPLSFDSVQIKWAKALDVRPNNPTSHDLNNAQLDELKSRLVALKIGAKDSDYEGFTPLYSLSIYGGNVGQFMIAGYDSDNNMAALQYKGEYYKITDTEFCSYLSRICAGEDISAATNTTLSLNDVIILSQKGYDLTWSDFENYDYIETGSGLYIRVYEINDMFQLMIGGGGPDSDPMYIYLALADDIDTRIDIRDGGVTEFISEHNSRSSDNGAVIPMVMVDGVLYLDTGLESTIDARCGVMDGEIKSSVDGTKQPTEDNQSNFGVGYGYQYGATKGTIEVYMDGTWWIFATEEVRQEIQFPSTTEEMNKFYLTIGAEGVKSIELSMPNSSGGFENADGSLLKKGERIWLENLDGYNDLRGLTITALGKNGEIIWTASIPAMEENKGFTHLVNDDWEITKYPV